MKTRCDISESDLARFCGPWSVSRKAVDVLIRDWEHRNETAEQSVLAAIHKYLESIRAFVAECEVKLPDDDDLPFWRDAVKFWEQVASTRDYPEPIETPKVPRRPNSYFDYFKIGRK